MPPARPMRGRYVSARRGNEPVSSRPSNEEDCWRVMGALLPSSGLEARPKDGSIFPIGGRAKAELSGNPAIALSPNDGRSSTPKLALRKP